MIVEPDWLRHVARDARLSVKEIVDIYGISASYIDQAIKSKRIPEPDTFITFGTVPKRFWSAGLIRRHIKDMRQQPAILRLDDVMERTGLAKSTIRLAFKEGRFPQPFKIFEGGRAIGFYEEEVNAWIKSRGR